MHSRISSGVVCLALLSVVFAASSMPTTALRSGEPQAQADPQPRPATGPQYDAAGELKRPTDYQTWIFVGSNLGLEYDEKAVKEKPAAKDASKPGKSGNFHNVYINPEAYADYVMTGKFPEKTVLILDIFKAEEREPGNIVSEGLFPGPQSGLAVAVKNMPARTAQKPTGPITISAWRRRPPKPFPIRRVTTVT